MSEEIVINGVENDWESMEDELTKCLRENPGATSVVLPWHDGEICLRPLKRRPLELLDIRKCHWESIVDLGKVTTKRLMVSLEQVTQRVLLEAFRNTEFSAEVIEIHLNPGYIYEYDDDPLDDGDVEQILRLRSQRASEVILIFWTRYDDPLPLGSDSNRIERSSSVRAVGSDVLWYNKNCAQYPTGN